MVRRHALIHDFNPAAVTTPLGTVYWYGLVYTIGFLGVFLWIWLRRHSIGMSRRDVATFTIVFAAAVLLGGRLFDIFVYEADYYRADGAIGIPRMVQPVRAPDQ
jgi:phosphatidylglycerol:prolipoprotein diacylglycerol transferase